MDELYKAIVEPIYDSRSFYGFQEGFISMERNKKWGFVDTTGKELIECKYEE